MFPLRDNIPSRRFPLVSFMLILLNLLVFLYEISLEPEQVELLISKAGAVPARLLHSPSGAVWLTLLTSLFLHGGWGHLIGNLWFLWIFGDNVEDRMGHGRFLGFYLLCGLLAGLTHVISNPSSRVPTVGASGAISGVLGAYFLLFPGARVQTLVLYSVMVVPAFFFLGLWFLMQLFGGAIALPLQGAAEGGVAWGAHIGGFLAGAFLVRPFSSRPPRRPPPRDEHGYLPY